MIKLIDKDLKMEDLLNWLKGLHDFIGANEEFERIGLWDFHQPLDEAINIVEQLCNGEWISVKDKSPKESGRYLVCVDDRNYGKEFKHWNDRLVAEAEFTCNRWYRWEDKVCYNISEFVTHWQQLPELPEEEWL